VTLETVGFGVVATALLASSLAVVLTPNLFHAVLYLAVALVATGVVWISRFSSRSSSSSMRAAW